MCVRLGFAARHIEDVDGRFDDVAERGQMREQVQMLKDHPDLAP